MLICKKCKRQTEDGETTGKFRTMVYIDKKDESKGTMIISEDLVCMNCHGERFLK